MVMEGRKGGKRMKKNEKEWKGIMERNNERE